jgi:hypothetical protein
MHSALANSHTPQLTAALNKSFHWLSPGNGLQLRNILIFRLHVFTDTATVSQLAPSLAAVSHERCRVVSATDSPSAVNLCSLDT